ncbi:MAG: type VI secretion system protein TssA [Candidatus Puniceispirillum sp.]|nr:type VI secretion system protein TssA [Candidatus Puniceispirillum sp.]
MMGPFQLSDEEWGKLIAPLPGKTPSGAFLLYDQVYDDIKQARTQEDDTLPQGIWQRDLKKADWHKVVSLCQEALSTRTKDLQIAAWLAEGWFMLHGIAGLVKGLELSRALTEHFWDTVHPMQRADDPEYRLSAYTWMNEKLEERIHFVTLTKPADLSSAPLNYADYLQAQQNDVLARRDPRLSKEQEKEGAVTLALYKRSQTLTPSSFYHDAHANLEACQKVVKELELFLMEKTKGAGGSLARLRATLGALDQLCTNALADRHELATTQETSVSQDLDAAANASAKKAVSAMGPIKTREEAYQRLAEAADFLARLEPHSPTPLLVRRAITWGNMPLVDLLHEIVADPNDYRQILQLLGVARKDA